MSYAHEYQSDYHEITWLMLLCCRPFSFDSFGMFEDQDKYVAIILKTEPGITNIKHYNDVIMSAMASQITGVSIVCSTFGSGADQRKHQSSASLAFVRGIHQWPMNSPQKGQWRGTCFHLMTSSWNRRFDLRDKQITCDPDHMWPWLRIWHGICSIIRKTGFTTVKPVLPP